MILHLTECKFQLYAVSHSTGVNKFDLFFLMPLALCFTFTIILYSTECWSNCTDNFISITIATNGIKSYFLKPSKRFCQKAKTFRIHGVLHICFHLSRLIMFLCFKKYFAVLMSRRGLFHGRPTISLARGLLFFFFVYAINIVQSKSKH